MCLHIGQWINPCAEKNPVGCCLIRISRSIKCGNGKMALDFCLQFFGAGDEPFPIISFDSDTSSFSHRLLEKSGRE